MTFSQFLTILRARWKLMIGTLAAVMLLVLAVNLVAPRLYTASAAVVVDVKSPDPLVGMVLPGLMAPGYIATQLDVLESERVARGVIKLLHLDENAGLREQWRDQTDGSGSYDAWLADLLQRNLDIKPSRESSVINISYTAVDPQFAAALANAFVRSYIDTTLDLRVEPAKQYANLFSSQAKQARDNYERAQTKLSEYQKQHGLLATDERLDIENARLAELSSQVVAIQSLSAEASSRKRLASSTSPDVLNSAVVGSMKSDLSRQEAHLKELSSRFGDAHPQVQELRANIAELQTKMAQEIAHISSSAGISSSISRSREDQARAALEQQRQRIFTLKAQRDEASVLLRDVESAQRALEAITARLNQTSIESQSTQTNVSVLKEATAPSKPSSPRTVFNTILGLLVGSMLALTLALVVELRDRRLRSEEDVTEGLNVPMLGQLPDATSAAPTRTLLGRKLPALPQRSLPELAGPTS